MSELPSSAAGVLLRRLKMLGIDMVFTNSGTDFPPIIESLAEGLANGMPMPEMVVVAHEHVAMGMAHGYYSVTGRAQAVILHTNVGLANGAIGAINAATERVPLITMSGRTPVTERGRFGARTVPIGWGQEMRDQTALVREASKWDYELRFPEQVPELVDRAHAIASSTPKGPVYISLPREVLSEPCPTQAAKAPVAMRPSEVVATPDQLARVAGLLLEAERPLIIAQRGTGTQAGFEALGRLALKHAIPVCQYWAVANSISADHPMYIGQDPEPWLSSADVVLVIDSLAPWMPDEHGPSETCTVIQMGPDPLFERFPVRNFRSDLAVRTEVGPSLIALEEMMRPDGPDSADDQTTSQRRRRIESWVSERRAAVEQEVSDGNRVPMSKEWVSSCLGAAIGDRRATVASELGCPMDPIGLTTHGSWRQEPHSGGLGWSFPFAMGMKLADPDRLVVATMGDGSYMFSNPVACHQVADRLSIGVLTLVLNDGGYGAVRDSVLHQYPDGYAAKAEEMPLIALPTAGDLAGVARACGAHAERVESPDRLEKALRQAIQVVEEEGRQAFVEVVVA